ncbi:MAG TPA: isoprenylcysteine carboxylmethyltransferase family protein [Terracidiphilus sp.]|nr:isoprenylcysteine carboxylmethyltransferase family protein [Terracidiphilus sp.]
MRATSIEFRLRMAINAVIILLGFWAPWIESWGAGKRISLVEWLALQISRIGIASFGVATSGVVLIALVFALAAVIFRVSGTAYLGPGTVNSFNMVAGNVMASGPYRYLRNPLYMGLWFMVAAMSFLMPATGALLAMVLITVFMIRLTFGEESFLTGRLGEPYQAYCNGVPRFIPRLRGAPANTGAEPHWLSASLAELTPFGVLAALAVFWRNYDLALAGRIILISFGASLVARAFLPRNVNPAPEN